MCKSRPFWAAGRTAEGWRAGRVQARTRRSEGLVAVLQPDPGATLSLT